MWRDFFRQVVYTGPEGLFDDFSEKKFDNQISPFGSVRKYIVDDKNG